MYLPQLVVWKPWYRLGKRSSSYQLRRQTGVWVHQGGPSAWSRSSERSERHRRQTPWVSRGMNIRLGLLICNCVQGHCQKIGKDRKAMEQTLLEAYAGKIPEQKDFIIKEHWMQAWEKHQLHSGRRLALDQRLLWSILSKSPKQAWFNNRNYSSYLNHADHSQG